MKADNYQRIENCKRGDIQAKEWLYKRYAPVLLGVCLRYTGNLAQGEDILHESFITIFSKIRQLKKNAALEAWMRKVVVNTALKQLKRENITYDINEIREKDFNPVDEDSPPDMKERILRSDVSQDDILDIIKELPAGYRTVFNLYAFENFRHKEIAAELGITEGTSRSQLQRARSLIQKRIYELVEKNEKSKKRKKAYFVSIFPVLNEKLEYIDKLVVDKLKDFRIPPSHPIEISLPGSGRTIGKINGKVKWMLISGKKIFWILSSIIGITGISLLIFFSQTRTTETPLLPDLMEQNDFPSDAILKQGVRNVPEDISKKATENNLNKNIHITNVDSLNEESNNTIIQSKKILVRKKVIRKKQVVIENQTARKDSI
jgi:RNA polymerase sigma-70 factor (ECF subfamily)